MANPFGGNDEALTVNNNHANYANLLYAVVPRSTTKFVEVVSAAYITPSAGTYDSDGYWDPNSTVTVTTDFTVSGLRAGHNFTVIVGFRRDTTKGAPDFSPSFGVRRAAETAYGLAQLSTDGDTAQAKIRDNAFQSGPNGTVALTNNVPFAVALKNNTTGPVQSGFVRISGNNSTFSDTALTLGTGTSDEFNRVGGWTASRYPVQYVFVYNVALDDSVINAIIDDPTSVISYTGSGAGVPKSTKLSLLGVG